MKDLDIVISGRQGEGKSRLARQIIRLHLPGNLISEDLANIDDLLEADLTVGRLALKYLEGAKPSYILLDSVLPERLTKAKEGIRLYRKSIGKPVLCVYVVQEP